MTEKQSGFWGGLGGTLTGVAALITSLLAAWVYFARDEGPSEPGDPVSTAHADQRAWRPEALAARKDMFDARRAAWSVQCAKTRPDAYARGEMNYKNAEEDFKGERYSVALETFKKAAANYRECG